MTAPATSNRETGAFDRDAALNRGYLYTTNAGLSSRLANDRLTDAALALGIWRGKRVVDIGCGDGTFTFDLSERGSPALIHGVDPAGEAIRVAREKAGARSVAFTESSGAALPFPDDAFDVAHLRGVLHHADRPLDLLREAFRVAPVLIVLEPNGYNPVLKCLEKLSRYHREHGEKSFSPALLDRWIRSLGGVVVSRARVGLVPFFCPDWMARVLKRLEPIVEAAPVAGTLGCAVYAFLARRER